MKKQKDELAECRQRITESINRWKTINQCGCNDPSWLDGVNMNLVRNHIIWYKRRLEELLRGSRHTASGRILSSNASGSR